MIVLKIVSICFLIISWLFLVCYYFNYFIPYICYEKYVSLNHIDCDFKHYLVLKKNIQKYYGLNDFNLVYVQQDNLVVEYKNRYFYLLDNGSIVPLFELNDVVYESIERNIKDFQMKEREEF